jgi:cell division septal protein FtsQ
VLGTVVRNPESIARALLESAGAPLSTLQPEAVQTLVMADPWIESAESFRLPDGTLLVRIVERRAVARYQAMPEDAIALVDPAGQRFMGALAAGGALPLVAGPIDVDASRLETALEILAELARHQRLAQDPSALTLHLPRSRATAGAVPGTGARDTTAGDDALAGDSGFVLELGREGPRVLLGQSFLKRRIARLASLLDQRDALLAGASVIDLRYADRAVLRTEPTSG